MAWVDHAVATVGLLLMCQHCAALRSRSVYIWLCAAADVRSADDVIAAATV